MATVLAFLLGAHALGCWVCGRDLKTSGSALRVVVGGDILMIAFFISGVCGFSRQLFPILLFGTALAGICFHGRRMINAFRLMRTDEKLFMGFGLIFSGYFLSPALCWPVTWDDLTYHLVLPLRWTAGNFPGVYPDLPYSGFPSGAEFIYWAISYCGGLKAPLLFIWTQGILTALLLFRLLRRIGGGGMTAGCLVFALLTSPVFFMIWKAAYVELMVLNHLLAFMIIWPRERSRRSLLTAALILGAVCAIKLNAVLLTIAGFWLLFSKRPSLKNIFTLLPAGLLALMTALPFYLRPWLATGNPLHPYFPQLFTSNPALLLCGDFHHAAAAFKYGVGDVWNFLAAPLTLCFQDRQYDGVFGWQWLMFCIPALLWWLSDWRSRGLCIRRSGLILMAIMLYCGWFFSAQQARFILPLAIPVMMAAASTLRRMPSKIRALLLLATMFATLFSMERAPFVNAFNCWKHLLPGGIDDKSYVYSMTGPGYLPACDMIGRLTPPDATIMLMHDNRGLYIPRRTILATPFFQSAYFTPPPDTADAFRDELRKSGATYLLLGLSRHNPDRQKPFMDKSSILFEHMKLLRERGELIALWSGDDFYLFQIKLRD